MKPCIAILEDHPARLALMKSVATEALPNHEHHFFSTAPSMLTWLPENIAQVGLISLDHDLDSTAVGTGAALDVGCGLDVVDYLATLAPICPIIVHTSNAAAGTTMVLRLRAAGWPVWRVYPRNDMEWIQADWANEIRSLIQNGWIF